MIDESYVYPGRELEVFSLANNWRMYIKSLLTSFIVGEVLEVGAGIGSTTASLCSKSQPGWLCLEPDMKLYSILIEKISYNELPPCCKALNSSVRKLLSYQLFDTVLYIDVLEHIENDRDELDAVVKHIKIGGRLIVLSPAYQWLYSPFDRAVGHYRRYTHTDLLEIAPESLEPVSVSYLDSVGMIASAANRILLKEKYPSSFQIKYWDRFLVPISKVLDPLFLRKIGKTVVVIWERRY